MSIANDFERQMLALINGERVSRGLKALQLEQRLNDSSEDHSLWMLNSGIFSHTGSGGSSATQRMRDADFEFSGSWASGENIAWQSVRGAPGISDDVVNLHTSLMNSPGHRANILSANFDYIGIGIEVGNFNGYQAVMVTQNFAKTSASVLLDTGAGTTPPGTPEPEFNFITTTAAGEVVTQGEDYTGPVAYLQKQLILTDIEEVVRGTSTNDFINSKGGTDAIDGGAGDDVLDGGTGSNFLTGGSGVDIFFTDARAAGSQTWTTITDFDPSTEEATIWGWRPGVSSGHWVQSDGAAGYKGATFHADIDGDGAVDTSITFSGLTPNQIQQPLMLDDVFWFA